MIFTTGAHQSAKFQTFGCSGEISPNLYFDKLLLLKVYEISPKKVQRRYVSWCWLKSDAKFEEKPICCFKNDKNLVNFDPSTQVSKIYTVLCPFHAKYLTFDQKKYRGVIFNDTGESCKIWRIAGLWLWKMTQGIWQIFTRALESLKIGTSIASFCSKLKINELKIYRRVMCHDNEEWCKIWRGIDLSVQNWHEKFDEFWPEHSKISKICTLMGCFWPKYIMFELKKVQRSYFWWHWRLL